MRSNKIKSTNPECFPKSAQNVLKQPTKSIFSKKILKKIMIFFILKNQPIFVKLKQRINKQKIESKKQITLNEFLI